MCHAYVKKVSRFLSPATLGMGGIPLFFLSLIFFTNSLLLGQKLNIKTYNIQEGLAQSQVFFISQDSRGYMWFATADGLSRYDGVTFKTYTWHDGLAANEITTGLRTRDGNIWFGHRHGGISIYYTAQDSFAIFKPGDNEVAREILYLFEDSSGKIWIASRGEGIFQYDGDKFHHITTDDGLLSNNVYSICESASQEIWFGTIEGISIYTPQTKQFRSLQKPEGLEDPEVFCLYTDSKARIWIGTWSGKIFIAETDTSAGEESSLKIKPFRLGTEQPIQTIMTFYEDYSGNIWIATSASGVMKFTPPSNNNNKCNLRSISVSNGLSVDAVNVLFQDREGNMWFGTNGGGVCKYSSNRFEVFTVDEGLTDNIIWEIFEDNEGNFWFAGEKGITKYVFPEVDTDPPLITHIDNFKGVKANQITAIYQDPEGKLWFGGLAHGLFVYDPKTQQVENITQENGLSDNDVLYITGDAKGRLWFATFGGGAVRYDPQTRVFETFTKENGLKSNYIQSIYIDRQGKVWFGTESGGLSRYDGRQITTFTAADGLNTPSVNGVIEDWEGNLWLGTPGYGLFKFDGKTFTQYTVNEGLSGDYIYVVICDNAGNIWAGTSKGLDKINPKTFNITHYGSTEGFTAIETNENAVFKDRKGNIWFGTIAGAIRYNPDEDYPNFDPPITHITNIRLFLHDSPIPADHVFPYNKNHLTFEFVGISFKNPEKVRYRYKLEGFDIDWSPVTNKRSATYSNLPPGDYTFKVKAGNESGIWNDTPATYNFVIDPPFWQTWWFRGVMVMVMVGLIYGVIEYKIRDIAHRKRELEEKVAERTRALQDEKEKVEQAYQALQESERKFREFTESSSSAIFIHQNGLFCYVNPAAERLMECSKEELLNTDVIHVVHPDFRDLVRSKAGMRKKGKTSYVRYEVKLLTRNGNERWIDLTTCMIDYGGEPAILGTAFDITERKKAEEALAEQEARLRTLINSMPDFVCFKDGEGRWLEANQFAIELFKMEGFDFHGKKDSELAEELEFYKDVFLTCERTDELAWNAGGPSQVEEAVPQPDGSVQIFEVIKVPIFKEDGSRKALVIIGRDITERKEAAEALMAEKERLAVTLRSIGDGVISTNRQGNIVLMNEEAEKLTGFSQNEAINKPLDEIFRLKDGHTGEPLPCPHQMVIETGQLIRQSNHTILISRDGQEHLIADSGAPIRDANGEIIGTVLVFRDVTEKRRLEEELFKAQKLESIGVLAGGIAHDFNNILTAILGNISLAKLSVIHEEKLYNWLSEAEKATSRAQELTQQLLTFSRGGAPVLKDISLQDLLVQTVEFVLRGSNVRSEFHIEDDLWSVKADEGQISQVLNNLVINAQQAMPEGGTIIISAENVSTIEQDSHPFPAGKYVKITIADEGVGIPEKLLSKIFDPYFTTKQAGSGLGLATSYSIIKKHHGYIEVESVVNEGTSFHIYLPALETPVEKSTPPTERFVKGCGKILVMDDDPMVREVIAHLLSAAGYQVDFATEGREAVEKYQHQLQENHCYDAVIMDLTIPGGMGGKETIQKLLEIDPGVKAIVSSGYSNDPVMAQFQKYGFKGIIKKPFKLKDITSVLQSVLTNGSK